MSSYITRHFVGTFAYAGGQLGTVLTMPISGQLAASSLGWPSIFYFFGILGIGWAVLFYCLGCDEPAVHSRISDAERVYIDQSLGNSSGDRQKIVSIARLPFLLNAVISISFHYDQNLFI
jgi:ACS family sodium-dependent inorganic phosphate cotransporter-like MFS transporter 5